MEENLSRELAPVELVEFVVDDIWLVASILDAALITVGLAIMLQINFITKADET